MPSQQSRQMLDFSGINLPVCRMAASVRYTKEGKTSIACLTAANQLTIKSKGMFAFLGCYSQAEVGCRSAERRLTAERKMQTSCEAAGGDSLRCSAAVVDQAEAIQLLTDPWSRHRVPVCECMQRVNTSGHTYTDCKF